jgi:hypothetical protein
MKKSTLLISLMIGIFTALFSFLEHFYKDDEENESTFFH